MDRSAVVSSRIAVDRPTSSSSFISGTEFLQTAIKCPKPELYKTELCRYWCAGLPCKFGNGCWFAHGPEELQIAQFVVPVLGHGFNSLDYEVRSSVSPCNPVPAIYQEHLPPNSSDSGISSGRHSSDGLSATSSDKELRSPFASGLKSTFNSSNSDISNDNEKQSTPEPNDLCDMYIWCGFCIMGDACPYAHSYLN